jgi:hypothetical protein
MKYSAKRPDKIPIPELNKRQVLISILGVSSLPINPAPASGCASAA